MSSMFRGIGIKRDERNRKRRLRERATRSSADGKSPDGLPLCSRAGRPTPPMAKAAYTSLAALRGLYALSLSGGVQDGDERDARLQSISASC